MGFGIHNSVKDYKEHPELRLLIPYDDLIKEIDKEIAFYENSSNSNDFEKWCNRGAIGALNSLKDNIGKLIVR